jgi:hypothetical protein
MVDLHSAPGVMNLPWSGTQQARFELAQKAMALFHTGVNEAALLKNAQLQELRTKRRGCVYPSKCR